MLKGTVKSGVTRMSAKEIKCRWNNIATDYAAIRGEHGVIHKEVLLNPAIFSLIRMIEIAEERTKFKSSN